MKCQALFVQKVKLYLSWKYIKVSSFICPVSQALFALELYEMSSFICPGSQALIVLEIYEMSSFISPGNI